MNTNLPTLEFILKNYKNFNSRATRDATIAYWRHVEKGGKMGSWRCYVFRSDGYHFGSSNS